MPMAAPAGNQHPVNIRSALRRNSLVSDPEDMLLLREKLTRIAVGSLAPWQPGDGGGHVAVAAEEEDEEDDDDAFDDQEDAYRRAWRRRRRPPPFQVFGLPPGDRPATPPSSPQPRDVLRRQLRIKNQSAAARRRLGSASVAGSDEEEEEAEQPDGRAGFSLRKPRASALVGTTFVSVDEVEITRLEAAVGDASIAPHATSCVATVAAASSPRVRLSIPSHLRVSSTFSVLNKCPEGMRKRKSVHVEEAAALEAAESNAMSRQGGGSLKKTSSQVNMVSHEHSEDLGSRMFKSHSSGALFRHAADSHGDDRDDQEMEEAWPDPEPPESPEASLGHPEK